MTPLDSLARGYSLAVTARRHRLPERTVLEVAYRHGWPDLSALETAARAARGLPPIIEEPTPPKPPRVPRGRVPAGRSQPVDPWAGNVRDEIPF